jgi:hypothetical protein
LFQWQKVDKMNKVSKNGENGQSTSGVFKSYCYE